MRRKKKGVFRVAMGIILKRRVGLDYLVLKLQLSEFWKPFASTGKAIIQLMLSVH
jgi:hypothetical protein